MKKWLCFLIFGIGALFTQGQGYLFNSHAPDYSADSLEFRFLCRDPQGLIYIGTNKGLFFYNGLDTKRILEGDFTAGFHAGSEIVLGDAMGLLYTAKGSRFRILSSYPVADSSAISDILVVDGKKYVATEGEGLIVLGNEQKRANTQNGLLTDDFVYRVEIFENDIWVATDRGVDRFWPSLEKKGHYSEPGLTRSMVASSDRIIFSGFSSGLLEFSSGSKRVSKLNNRSGLEKILSINDEIFALEKGELLYLDGQHWRRVGNRSDIVDIVETHHGNLLSLHSNGDIGFADLNFLYFDIEYQEEISALLKSGDRLFAASPGALTLVDLVTGESRKRIPLESDLVIVDMALINNSLYCATFNRGLFEVNLESETKKVIEGLPDESVLSLATDGNELWISTLSGLSRKQAGKPAKLLNLGEAFPSTYIYKVFYSDNALWLGTDGRGVFKYQNGKAEPISTEGGSGKLSIYDISSDQSGTIYAMSLELGMLKLDRANNQFIITGTFRESEYKSWGVGLDGTFTLASQEGLRIVSNGIERRYPGSYFPTNLSGAFIHTFAEWSDPWLYFASGKGLYGYRSGKISYPPKVILTDWKVNFEDHSPGEVKLSAGDENHSFHFASTSYRNPENQDILIRLRGYETNFRSLNSREVNFSRLPHGKYTLEAIYAENEVSYPQTFELVSFKIARPVYFQWWFIAISLILFALAIYAFIQVRVNRLNKSRLAEQKLLESELALLRNQVNPHFLFNSFNTLMNLIEQSPGEANEYLQRLSDFYRRMLEKHEDQVVTLAEELELAREYVFLQKKRFGDSFRFVEKVDKERMESFIPVLTLQLLIENAIKHNIISRANPLEIILEEREGHLCIRNRIASKREPVEGTGMGLENIRKRYISLFNSEINVKEHEGWFEVYLPLVN